LGVSRNIREPAFCSSTVVKGYGLLGIVHFCERRDRSTTKTTENVQFLRTLSIDTNNSGNWIFENEFVQGEHNFPLKEFVSFPSELGDCIPFLGLIREGEVDIPELLWDESLDLFVARYYKPQCRELTRAYVKSLSALLFEGV
jgi:hypothetical protein